MPVYSLQDGDTPLMRAVRTRNELCVRFLLDKGAKVGVYDKVSGILNFNLSNDVVSGSDITPCNKDDKILTFSCQKCDFYLILMSCNK